MIYKNKTDQDLTIPNVGVVKAGGTIESTVKLESQNLELVSQPANQQTSKPAEGGIK